MCYIQCYLKKKQANDQEQTEKMNLPATPDFYASFS